MIKHCKCNPKKTENEFCDHCGKRKDECVCDNMETGNYREETSQS